jgi:predicted dehydrogenase
VFTESFTQTNLLSPGEPVRFDSNTPRSAGGTMTKGSSKASRREIIKGAGLATASAMFWYPSGKVLGANDRVNLAVIGMRGQGGSHINPFGKIPGVHIKTLCDVDENISARRAAGVEKEFKYRAETVWDMRRVFDDKDIHAVTIATPNHWHALASIWAAQAGKNVYVEKPACHTVWEGRQMVNAARKHKVIMQVGFQNRSRKNTTAAIKFLHGGGVGKIFRARGLCYKRRGNIGRYPDGPMSGGQFITANPNGSRMEAFTASYLQKVHYDNWIGPAEQKPFNPNRFHYNWHWQWPYGGGDTANQGPHQFDVARWGLNQNDGPVKVTSSGGMFVYKNSQQETPNEQLSVFTYADGTILEFETRGLPTNAEGMHFRGRDAKALPTTPEELLRRSKNTGILIGDIFYGDKGRLEIDDSGRWTAFDHDDNLLADSATIKEEESDARVLTGSGSGSHYENFINAVKSGQQSQLTCDIEQGFRSTILPLIANVSYRLGRELKWDGKKERFVGDNEANAMLKRNDRAGYVVPNLGNGAA